MDTSGTHVALSFADLPMRLARWPNVAAPPSIVPNWTSVEQVIGNATITTALVLVGERPRRWKEAGERKELMLHGFWRFWWRDIYVSNVSAALHADGKYRVELGNARVGTALANSSFYALNVAEELDCEGEYFIDRVSETLLFFPPKHARESNDSASLSVAPRLLTITDASNLRFSDITFRGSRGTLDIDASNGHFLSNAKGSAVSLTGGANVSFERCNMLLHGGHALQVTGGTNHSVRASSIAYTGSTAVMLDGGNRTDLTRADHTIEDSVVHHNAGWFFTYNPAIFLNGVGCAVLNCELYGTLHSAILFAGNDHLIDHTWIHDAVLETYDSGAIYAGRDFTWRGIVISNNIFGPNIGRAGSLCSAPLLPCVKGRACNSTSTSCVRSAIYLDDHLSGATITGNVFLGAQNALPTGPDLDQKYGNTGVMVNGGRDHNISNNLFIGIGLPAAVHGKAQWRGKCGTSDMKLRTGLFASLFVEPYQKPPWSQRYPRLVDILQNYPCQPLGNVLAKNIVVNSSGISKWLTRTGAGWRNNGGLDGWSSIGCATGEAVGGKHIECCQGKNEIDCFRFGQNLVSRHPGFVAPDPLRAWDFALAPASKAWAMGWRALPATNTVGPRRVGAGGNDALPAATWGTAPGVGVAYDLPQGQTSWDMH